MATPLWLYMYYTAANTVVKVVYPLTECIETNRTPTRKWKNKTKTQHQNFWRKLFLVIQFMKVMSFITKLSLQVCLIRFDIKNFLQKFINPDELFREKTPKYNVILKWNFCRSCLVESIIVLCFKNCFTERPKLHNLCTLSTHFSQPEKKLSAVCTTILIILGLFT